MKLRFLAFLLLLTILASLSVSATWTSVLVDQNDTHGDGDILSTGTKYYNFSNTIKSGFNIGNYRAFLDFNISSIPDGSTINSVVLQLTPSNSPANDIVVYGLSDTSLNLELASTLHLECEGSGSARNYSTSSVWTTQNSPTNFTIGGSSVTDLGNALTSNSFSVCLHNFEAEDASSGMTQFYANESFGVFPEYVPTLWVEYNTGNPLSTTEPHLTLNSQTTNISIPFNTTLDVVSWGVNGTAYLVTNITGVNAVTTSNTSYLLAAGIYNFTVLIDGTASYVGSNRTWQVNVTKISAPLLLSLNGSLLTSNTKYSVWEDEIVLLATSNNTGAGFVYVNLTDNSSGSSVVIIDGNESTTKNFSSSLLDGLDFIEVNLTLTSGETENFSQTNTSYYLTINRSIPTWISFSPSFTIGDTKTIDLTNYIAHPTDSEFTYSSTNGTTTNLTITNNQATFSGNQTGTETIQINTTDQSGDNATINITVTIKAKSSGGGSSSGSSNSNSYTTIVDDSETTKTLPIYEPTIIPQITDEPITETEPSVEENNQLKEDLVEVSCTENCDEFYNNLLEQMEEVKDKVELTKNTYFNNETNKTITNITLKILEDLEDFEYVQSIPKCMAIAAHLIEFKELPSRILKDDPLIAWQFTEIKAGTELDLSFDVLGQIPEDCYGLVQEMFFEKQSPPNYRNRVIGIVLIILLVSLVIVAQKKK